MTDTANAPEQLVVNWTIADEDTMPATVSAHTPKSRDFEHGSPRWMEGKRLEYVLSTHCAELVAAAYVKLRGIWYTRDLTPTDFDAPDVARAALSAYGERMKAEGAREAQAKIARLTEALRPFSQMAGEMFARNRDASDIAIALDNPEQTNRVYVSDFFAARKAIGAEHASDCAVHNGPAYPLGSCTCGAALQENANE